MINYDAVTAATIPFASMCPLEAVWLHTYAREEWTRAKDTHCSWGSPLHGFLEVQALKAEAVMAAVTQFNQGWRLALELTHSLLEQTFGNLEEYGEPWEWREGEIEF